MNEFEKAPSKLPMTNDLLAYGRFCRHYGMKKNLAREAVIPIGTLARTVPMPWPFWQSNRKYDRKSSMNIIRSPDEADYFELNDMGNRPKEK